MVERPSDLCQGMAQLSQNVKESMKPSVYQQAILDRLATHEDNLLIEATAGSGKTTTLTQIAKALPSQSRVLALCFNKSVSTTLQTRMPPNARCSTIHAEGYLILRTHWTGVEMDLKKDYVLYCDLFGKPVAASKSSQSIENWIEYQTYKLTRRFADLIRGLCIGSRSLEVLEKYVLRPRPNAALLDKNPELRRSSELQDQLTNLWGTAQEQAVSLVSASRKWRAHVSYTDMFDLPLFHDLYPPLPYDFILGDEVQDWNNAYAELVDRLATGKTQTPTPPPPPPVPVSNAFLAEVAQHVTASVSIPKAPPLPTRPPPQGSSQRPTVVRLVLVGDRNQAIYMFNGANPSSMDDLKVRFECTEMPLSVCYRCATSIVQEAQDIAGPSAIQARDGAPEGTVEYLDEEDMGEAIDSLKNGDMIICRYNAPLMKVAFRVIETGRRPVVRDGSMIKPILELATELHGKTDSEDVSIEDFQEALQQHRLDTIQRYEANGYDTESTEVVEYLDKWACLSYITSMPHMKTAHHVKQWLFELEQTESDTGVILSTIHRAKGLEANTVVYLGYDIPPPISLGLFPNSADHYRQETNLRYVATTRAISRLIHVKLQKRPK